MLTKPDFMAKKVVLVFTKKGDKISFKNDNLIITDFSNKIKLQVSCYKLFAIYIVGGYTLTSGLIEKCKKFGFSIVFYTMSFKVYASINFYMEGNTLLRKKQYYTKKGSNIAKALIINKIENQRNVLKKIRDKDIIDGILNLDLLLNKLVSKEYTDEEIMGIEGIAAKIYFKRLYKNFQWKGRQPRVKRDEINLLLDIGYTALFNYLEGIVNLYGFDIYKGNLHKEFYKRKSLICDIIEPFRPIVDYKIRKMLNLGQLKDYSYKINNMQYQLNWEDSSLFISEILSEINNYKGEIFDYIQTYYRWFMKEKDIIDFPKVVLGNDNN